MSAASAARATSPRAASTPQRRLRVVEAPARARRPRMAYGIVAVLGAFLIGAAQMSLSILTTQTTYQIAELTAQQRDLTWQKQVLFDEVAGLGSPQYLAANAAALGMVINESPTYLRLSDAAILGAGGAAIGATTVDAIGRGSVPNALVVGTPLVTDPDATIEGVPLPVADESVDGVPNTPPPITDGLPTPDTH